VVMPVRVLVGKAGLDKHDRGARIVARALRDAGYEVVYIESGHTPEEVASVARDEDVTAVGLSILSGAHLSVFRELRDSLAALGLADVLLFAGGTIPPADAAMLRDLGVGEVFGPGTPTRDIVAAFDRYLRADSDVWSS